MPKATNILIIGATGLVGAAVASALAESYRVVCVSSSTGHNISDFGTLRKLRGKFATVVHCAASFEGDSFEGGIRNCEVNTAGTINVCRLAVAAGCEHIVYLSSISAIESPRNEYFNSYALSKKHGEDYVRFFGKQSCMPYTILRFSQIYDSDGKAARHQHFLYALIDQVHRNIEIEIAGRKNPLRNFIHINDVVEIVRRVVERKVCGEYACVSPASHRILSIVRTVRSVLGRDVAFKLRPDKPDMRSIYIPRDTALYEEIGYKPVVELTEGIQRIAKRRYG